MRAIIGLLLLLSCCADKFPLDDEGLVVKKGTPLLVRNVPMYTPEDAPSKSSPGNGDSYVKIKIKLKTSDARKVSGQVEVLMIHADAYSNIGIHDVSTRYCCLPSDVTAGKCTRVGSLITSISDGEQEVYKTFLDSDSLTITSTFNVHRSGQQLLIISNCEIDSDLEVSGMTTWMNPYGYLPGQAYGFMGFYGDMALVYLCAALIWFVLNAVYFREVFALQNYIALVLSLCMIEMATWYFDYHNLNNTGVRNGAAIFFGIFMSAFRRAVSRMLIIAVSYGWGVVRPTLGKAQTKITVLGFVYFVFEFVLEMTIRFSHHREISKALRVILAIPVAVCNAIFYYWIFATLYRLITQLKARNQEQKLWLYKRFTMVLVSSAVASVLFSAYEMYFIAKKLMLTQWSSMWILDGGFEQLVYSVILFCVAFLWRPSSNSRRYAYAQVGKNEEADFGDMELPEYATGNAGQRTAHYESEDDDGPEPKFTIDEDPEAENDEDELINVTEKLE